MSFMRIGVLILLSLWVTSCTDTPPYQPPPASGATANVTFKVVNTRVGNFRIYELDGPMKGCACSALPLDRKSVV